MAPPQSFNYALFSLSDVTTKNNNLVCGDIWANTYVTVYQNDSVLSADNDAVRTAPPEPEASRPQPGPSASSTTPESTATLGRVAMTLR